MLSPEISISYVPISFWCLVPVVQFSGSSIENNDENALLDFSSLQISRILAEDGAAERRGSIFLHEMGGHVSTACCSEQGLPTPRLPMSSGHVTAHVYHVGKVASVERLNTVLRDTLRVAGIFHVGIEVLLWELKYFSPEKNEAFIFFMRTT